MNVGAAVIGRRRARCPRGRRPRWSPWRSAPGPRRCACATIFSTSLTVRRFGAGGALLVPPPPPPPPQAARTSGRTSAAMRVRNVIASSPRCWWLPVAPAPREARPGDSRGSRCTLTPPCPEPAWPRHGTRWRGRSRCSGIATSVEYCDRSMSWQSVHFARLRCLLWSKRAFGIHAFAMCTGDTIQGTAVSIAGNSVVLRRSSEWHSLQTRTSNRSTATFCALTRANFCLRWRSSSGTMASEAIGIALSTSPVLTVSTRMSSKLIFA